MKNLFFDGLKIVEFANAVAGPAAGLMFAELGASVIKIENKRTGGDITRKWKLASEKKESNLSAYFCSVNWGKESHFLDLSQNSDLIFAYSLVEKADIIISNFKRTSAKRLKLDYEHLIKIAPEIIYGQVDSYSSDDETPAFDIVFQAETGYLSMTGQIDGPAAKMPIAVIDLLTAHQLKEGLLVALLNKAATGKGAFISVSLYHTAIASLLNQATNWLMEGHIPKRMGTRHPNIAPYGDLFTDQDGKEIVLAVGTGRQFLKLCSILGIDELVQNPKFGTNEVRVENRDELNSKLQEKIGLENAEDLVGRLKEAGVPCGILKDLSEVFASNEVLDLILQEELKDGTLTKCVKTAVFEMKSPKTDKK